MKASVIYSHCIACEACINSCPNDAIIMKDRHAKVIYDKCVECGNCISICPVGAIEEKDILPMLDNIGVI